MTQVDDLAGLKVSGASGQSQEDPNGFLAAFPALHEALHANMGDPGAGLGPQHPLDDHLNQLAGMRARAAGF